MGGFEVFEDFLYYSQGVYEHVWGASVGYHAVTLVGWDDVEGCWIAKNSWDTSWGEDGWFKIAYGQCSLEQYVFAIDGVELPACTCADQDGDGFLSADCDDPFCSGNDCDDSDPGTYPGAPAACDGVADNDCDGQADPGELDEDGDGVSVCGGDCDDTDDRVFPGAAEVCDGVVDNDCDGVGDPAERDGDGDGYSACDGDEDDQDPDVYPGADDGADDDDSGATPDDGFHPNGDDDDDDDDDDDTRDTPIDRRVPPPGCSCDQGAMSSGTSALVATLFGLILLAGRRLAPARRSSTSR